MSLIKIPCQFKVPEVFTAVKYDGTNIFEINLWELEGYRRRSDNYINHLYKAKEQ